jgi:hypothetical protein
MQKKTIRLLAIVFTLVLISIAIYIFHPVLTRYLTIHTKALIESLFILVIIFLVLWLIPRWQVAQLKKANGIIIDPAEPSQAEESTQLSLKDIFNLENEARRTIAQIVGGLVFIVGLYFTAENLRITQEAANKTQRITQEGQITDRFSKAISQLGDPKLEIRLGGIYALERIAKDSEKDHWTIMEVLTAYVREHSPRSQEQMLNDPKTPQEIAADVQAVLNVIGRRERVFPTGEVALLDLRGTNLRKADLSNAYLVGAMLNGADLSEANLRGADLRGADLSGVLLNKTELIHVNIGKFSPSKPIIIDFQDSDSRHQMVINFGTRTEKISGDPAQIYAALAGGTNLSGADLSEARFRWEQIDKSIIDNETKFNTQFDEQKHAKLEEQSKQQSNQPAHNK